MEVSLENLLSMSTLLSFIPCFKLLDLRKVMTKVDDASLWRESSQERE